MSEERGRGRKGKKRAASQRGAGARSRAGVEGQALFRAKQLLGFAAAGMLLGVALVATGETTVGPWVTVASLSLGIGAAHALGRCGPDPGLGV